MKLTPKYYSVVLDCPHMKGYRSGRIAKAGLKKKKKKTGKKIRIFKFQFIDFEGFNDSLQMYRLS